MRFAVKIRNNVMLLFNCAHYAQGSSFCFRLAFDCFIVLLLSLVAMPSYYLSSLGNTNRRENQYIQICTRMDTGQMITSISFKKR